jgi:hypothetical protein
MHMLADTGAFVGEHEVDQSGTNIATGNSTINTVKKIECVI